MPRIQLKLFYPVIFDGHHTYDLLISHDYCQFIALKNNILEEPEIFFRRVQSGQK